MIYRVIFSDNGTLTDFSVNLNEYSSGTHVMPFTAGQDYLYIGSRYPFNSLYIKMSVLNVIASTMTVNIWDGNTWRSTVDLIDETAGLTASGYVTFVPSKANSGWSSDDTVENNGNESITGLGNATIYDLYWMRISFGTTITAGTALSWIGHIFCSDVDLYSEFPMFNSTSLKTAFESGKTTWEEQRVMASNLVIEDMIYRGLILHPGQILDRQKLRTACISKTAQMIFTALGDDYKDDATAAKNEYEIRIKNGVYNLDQNNNARIDEQETRYRQGFITR